MIPSNFCDRETNSIAEVAAGAGFRNEHYLVSEPRNIHLTLALLWSPKNRSARLVDIVSWESKER